MTQERITTVDFYGKKHSRVIGERLPDINRRWSVKDVEESKDGLVFAAYCQQVIGVPYPNLEHERILRHKINEMFKRYPRANWGTLCRLVLYCKDHKYRPDQVWKIFTKFNMAWKAGVLPELEVDASNPILEEQIRRVLIEETDMSWRRKLLMAQGDGQQRKVLREWMNKNQTLS